MKLITHEDHSKYLGLTASTLYDGTLAPIKIISTYIASCIVQYPDGTKERIPWQDIQGLEDNTQQ